MGSSSTVVDQWMNKKDPRDVLVLRNIAECTWQEHWFDAFGNEIHKSQMIPDNLAFLVVPQGDVIGIGKYEWCVVGMIEPTTNLPDCALAQPVRVFVGDDANTHVEYRWLKYDDQIEGKNTSKLHLPDILLDEDENSSLPLTSFCCHLRNMPHTELQLPNYTNVFRVFQRWWVGREQTNLGTWTEWTGRQHANEFCVDVHDALEFYFITPEKRIWRTRLGTFLWSCMLWYLPSNVSPKELIMWQNFLNCRSFKKSHASDSGGGGLYESKHTCDLCDKPFLTKKKFYISRFEGNVSVVDRTCLDNATRFVRLGSFIRKLRRNTRFSPNIVTDIVMFLETLIS